LFSCLSGGYSVNFCYGLEELLELDALVLLLELVSLATVELLELVSLAAVDELLELDDMVDSELRLSAVELELELFTELELLLLELELELELFNDDEELLSSTCSWNRSRV
jgi:hypothetical protein